MAAEISRISPVLTVSNIKEAIDWYARALGFSSTYINNEDVEKSEDTWNYALLENGETEIHLCKNVPNDTTLSAPSNCYLYVHDIQSLHAHLLIAGEDVTDLNEMPWGNLECWLHDPDGNRLVLSSPI